MMHTECSSIDDTPVRRPKKAKRKHETHHDALNDMMKAIDTELAATKEAEDDVYHYCLSLTARLRRLTPYQQAVCKQAVEQAFFNAEFNTPPNPPSFIPHNPPASFAQSTNYSSTYTQL